MRVTQYRIADYNWDERDEIYIMTIICDRLDVNTILKRLKKRDKYILCHFKITVLDNTARISFHGRAYMWQEIEDEFPSLSDKCLRDKRCTERRILDMSLLDERKKEYIIINGVQYFRNPYLGTLRKVFLN